MKLSDREKAAQKAAFRAMSPAQKLDHILTYYKWPILLGLIALVILGSVLHRQLTRKEPVLYAAMANVAVGSDLEQALTDGYLLAAEGDTRRQEVYLYRDLYLSENADTVNHEYAYASRMKLMGAVQSQNLDVVFMNREAYDLLSSNGYLLELAPLLEGKDPALYARLASFLVSNAVTLSDNGIEWKLGEAETHQVVTEERCNGLALRSLPRFQAAGFPAEVYFGVIANSPRVEEVLPYLRYLAEGA
jgi:hypothetical protein